MKTDNTTPIKTSEKYDIWLATQFSVTASSYDEANVQAVTWLAARLAAPADAGSDSATIAVTRPAQNLQDAAVLALKLLALEAQSGDALRCVEQLRAEREQAHTFAPVFHLD